MKKILILILVLCVGFGAWKFFSSSGGKYSKLDYKMMDEKGMSREMVEPSYEHCMAGKEGEPYESYCACVTNGMVRYISSDELVALGRAQDPQTVITPDLAARMQQIGFECQKLAPQQQ